MVSPGPWEHPIPIGRENMALGSMIVPNFLASTTIISIAKMISPMNSLVWRFCPKATCEHDKCVSNTSACN
ncbi:hypothetical protein Bca4012_040449 [Brassica carinata]